MEKSVNICGIPTKIVRIDYNDRVFVTITQLQAFGTLISIEPDITTEGHLSFNTRILLGKREEEADIMSLCARRIGEMIYQKSRKPTVVSLGLKPDADTEQGSREICEALFS